LVLGIPILDVIWVVVRRLKIGGIKNVFHGDRKHLHHRLLDLGLSQKRVVFIYIFVASAFGVSTLFLQSRQKLVALILLGLMMLVAATILVQQEKTRNV
jgi:UDP-GlcNAc:undecaprenyl-phosphate GlcNAc-1-phosphate transferase